MGSLIDLGLEYNVLEKKGSWIVFNGKMISRGRESAKQSLQKPVKLYSELEKTIVAKVNFSGATVLAENVKDLKASSAE
jgi:recombination protein RecA